MRTLRRIPIVAAIGLLSIAPLRAAELEIVNIRIGLIRPEIAIVSAGNGNDHKHPTNGVLKRLVAAGVDRVLQTSWGTTRLRVSSEVRDHQAIYQGDVVISTDGESFEISTARRWDLD